MCLTTQKAPPAFLLYFIPGSYQHLTCYLFYLILLIDAAFCLSALLNASFQKAGLVTLLSPECVLAVYHIVCARSLSHVLLCDPMDCSPPGSSVRGFCRQECCSGSPCPPPGDRPHPVMEPVSPASSALTGGFFTTEPLGKATINRQSINSGLK